MYRTLVLAAVAGLLVGSASRAADWPQWRGPNRDAISTETGLLASWPAGGLKPLWTISNAGSGYSGFATAGPRVLTMGADDSREFVLALEPGTGKELWRTPFGDRFQNDWGDGPRGTPTIDGDRVYVLGGQGTLACLDLATGKVLWTRSMQSDFGGQMMSGWGYSESPLVDGDKVLCTPGGPKGAIVALDKKTGDPIWRSTRFTDPAAYSSLVIGQPGGVRQYVQMTGDSVAGVAADDGRLLWRFPRHSPTAAIPTPIVRDDWVFVTSAYDAGGHLLKIGKDDKGNLAADQVYHATAMENHHGGVILLGDHVYGASNKGGWTCMEFKTGKVVWQEKKLGNGSMTCADGRFILYSEDKGTVVLLEPSPSGWKEKGRFTIPRETTIRKPRGRIWTHPVVSNGKLYLRDQDLVFCFDVKDHGDR